MKLWHWFLGFVFDFRGTAGYLFARPERWGYVSDWRIVCWWTCIWCRFGGHRAGPVFYNVSATEPDMKCRGCGDELG